MPTKVEKKLLQDGAGRTVYGSQDSTVVSELPQTVAADINQFFVMSNGTDAANDIDIAPAVGLVNDKSETILLTTTLTKQLDAAWAEGTALGGLDTGSKAVDTWYHVHLITKDTDGTVDALFSLSKAAPTVPGGWTLKKRIGSIVTDSSGDIVGFYQADRYFHYRTHQHNYSYSAAGLNDFTANVALLIPDDIKLRVRASLSSETNHSTANLLSIRPFGDAEHAGAGSPPLATIPAISGDLAGPTGTVYGDSYLNNIESVLLDSNDTIAIHYSNTVNLNSASLLSFEVFTLGWEDMEI